MVLDRDAIAIRRGLQVRDDRRVEGVAGDPGGEGRGNEEETKGETMSNERAWLDGLKAGDTVARTRGYGQPPELRKVVRVTSTMIVIGESWRLDGELVEGRYNRKYGRAVGADSFSPGCLIQPTPAIMERIDLHNLTYTAIRLRESLPIPTDRAGLEAFIAALTPFVPVKK